MEYHICFKFLTRVVSTFMKYTVNKFFVWFHYLLCVRIFSDMGIDINNEIVMAMSV